MKQGIKTKGKRNWWLLPLEVILIFLPLVLGFHSEITGYGEYPWCEAGHTDTDMFLYQKMIVFSIITVVTLVALIWNIVKMKKEVRKKSFLTFLPLFIYLGFVILSTIASKDLNYSLKGAADQYEPFPVLFGYVVVIFYAYIMINTVEDVKQITEAALIGGFIMAVIGILQAMGIDPIMFPWVQRLYIDKEVLDMYEIYSKFPSGQAYGTLYNPNYVGSYVALYFPLMLVGSLISKVLWKRLLYIATAFGLLIFLFASQSRTGLISIVVIVLVFLLFKSKEAVKRWYLVIPAITFVVLSFSLLDTYRDNLLSNRLKQMFAIEKSTADLKGIDTTGNAVRVVYKDTEFTVRMAVSETDFGYAVFEGEEQKKVTYSEYKQYAYFTLNNGEEITIQTAVYADYEDAFGFVLTFNNRPYYFSNQIVMGDYKYLNEQQKVDECVIIENPLQGYESVASGRGYVFGRTFPLLSKYFFIGSGPDTFAITFPQNDYVARFQSGFGATFFTRPHNFYLQMGVQTGTLSLITFLVFLIMYIVGCCRRYFFKKFTRTEEWFGFALFLAVVGFMAVGFANDSLIVVSPMFYVLFGTGIAVNHKLCLVEKKERGKVTEVSE